MRLADSHGVSTSVSRRPRIGRLAVLGILGLVAIAGSIWVWQFTTLSGLPDIGEPFDVARYGRIEIPADENAYTFYRRAFEMSKGINCPRSISSHFSDWKQVNAEQLKYLEDSRAAMAVWLEGTKRERAVYHQPGEATFETLLPVTQEARNFARRMNLQALKLQHEGDLVGSWSWIRANLRTSQHIGMNGFLIERLVGIWIFTTALQQAKVWADDPRVDAKMLRAALDDVIALEAFDRSPSQVVRAEYFSGIKALRDQETSERMLTFIQSVPAQQQTWNWRMRERIRRLIATLRHEPERSRRVWRLITANLLSACDLPSGERKPRVEQFGNLTLYAPAPGDPSMIAPEELARWFESTYYAKEFLFGWTNIENKALAGEETDGAILIVHLAEQLYKREKGREPTAVDELIGPYLKAIPRGYVPPQPEPSERR